MKLASLIINNKQRPALCEGGDAVLLEQADFPEAIAALMQGDAARGKRVAMQDAKFGLPVSPLSKILCVGLNYVDHAKEGNQPIPEHPVFFSRFISSFTPHETPVMLPAVSEKFDYEAELTIVVGKRLRDASEAEALAGIFGYTVGMDGSIRDYQKRHVQWTLGKNFDASGSLGPWIVSADELPENARGLAVQTRLNGEVMQDGNTAEMIFPPAKVVSILSSVMTLNPGDLILTGTPAGVGFARTPPVYLKAGDVVETGVEGVGILTNTVIPA